MELQGRYRWVTWSQAEDFLSDWEELRSSCSNCPHPTAAEIASWAADESLFDSATSTQIELLLSLLSFSDEKIRRATITVLKHFDFGDDGTLDRVLIDISQSTNELVKMDGLEYLMSSAPIVVTRGLFAEDESVRSKLLRFLTDDSDESPLGLMQQWYASGDARLRFAVIESLGIAPKEDAESIDLLIEAATDKYEDADIIEAALGSLSKHYPELQSLLDRFARAFLSDGDPDACSAAANKLWEHACPLALSPLLIRLFEFDSVSLRAAVSFALMRQNGSSVSDEVKLLSKAASSVPDSAALLKVSKDPRDFGLALLADFIAHESDDRKAFEAAEVTLSLSTEKPAIIREIVEGTVWREGFFQTLNYSLPDWATNEVLKMPDANGAVVEYFFRYPEEPGFASSVLAFSDFAIVEASDILKSNAELWNDSVPILLSAAGDSCGNLDVVRPMLDLIDTQCPDEMQEIKHTLIPLLLNPKANARRIIRIAAENSWLRWQWRKFAQRKVSEKTWIGSPDEIVDDFLSSWWQKLIRTTRTKYDVGRHRAFSRWLQRTFHNTVEGTLKKPRTIRKRERACEVELLNTPQRDTGVSDVHTDRVQAVMARMSELQQNIFWLTAEGRSNEQIAIELGIKTDQVEYAKRSVRSRLKPIARTFFDM